MVREIGEALEGVSIVLWAPQIASERTLSRTLLSSNKRVLLF